jgi:diguanylate cyclase (GGDEF)-like protein/PAS domain S-box-containing protein
MSQPSLLAGQRGYSALVVDDDPVMRVLARQVLEADGAVVREAADGRAAVELFRASPPDIVLMDVLMPELDGFGACAAIRATAEGNRTPILMLTGLDDLESINRAYEAGATDFANKPINWSILAHRVRYMLRSAQAIEELFRSKDSLADAQRIAHLGGWEWDLSSGRFDWSDETYRILGMEPGSTSPAFERLLERIHPEERDALREEMSALLRDSGVADSMHRLLLPDGGVRHVHIRGVTKGTNGTRVVSGTIQDVTERKRAEEKIRHLAYYDGLTSLPNRQFFVEQLQRAIALARRHERLLAVLSIDLDQFKRINDTLGRQLGDELLLAVAQRLSQCVRSSDGLARLDSSAGGQLARLGGDEFSLLVLELASFHDATKVAQRVLEELQTPFRLGDNEVVVTASIGIALFPNDADTPESLLQQADTAMHFAKEQGRKNYQFYGREMNATALERLSMETQLRRALDRGELILHYQPKVEARSGLTVGVEALVRWMHPELGMVGPNQFIPIAEESGLILPIGEWVLREACAQARRWQDQGYPPLGMAVNIAGPHFQQPGLLRHVAEVLRSTGVAPGCLELEVTESMLMNRLDNTLDTLRRLKGMGVKLAMDDFGTGYSSLAYLKRFPLDTLKIDRSFIKDMPGSVSDATMVSAIIAMAHSLKLSVVAEGVERLEQLEFLKDKDCDLIQGYLVSRPQAAESLTPLLGRRLGTATGNGPNEKAGL